MEDTSMPCSLKVRKTQSFAARSSGHKAGTLTLDLEDLGALGNQDADLEESRVAVDTNAISVERKAGLSLPSGMGEGNNSPVGAVGATRLTGLNPGARLCE